MKLSTSTKALLIAAAAIILLFVLGDRFGMRSNTKDPREFVIELDTSVVVSIRFEDRADPRNDLQLIRRGSAWERIAQRTDSLPPTQQARNLLAQFQRVPVKRDMGMILLLGDRYQLTDTTLCRITFADAEGQEDALNLGSSTFAPGKVGAWTYVNVPGEKEVYAVEGLLVGDLRPGQ